jgi:hypothetical protein
MGAEPGHGAAGSRAQRSYAPVEIARLEEIKRRVDLVKIIGRSVIDGPRRHA